MKKLCVILAAVCLFFSCSNEKSFKITGTITNLGPVDQPYYLYLKTRNAEDKIVNLDSTILAADGTFTLKGKTAEPDLFYVGDKDNILIMGVFVEPGVNSVLSCDIMDYPTVIIEGSENQALYDNYLGLIKPLKEEQNYIREKYSYQVDDYSLPPEEQSRILDELVSAYNQLDDDIKERMLNFVKAHPDKFVAAYLVNNNARTLNKSYEIEELLQLLDPNMNNKFVRQTKEYLNKVKSTEVGQVFPIIELPDPQGNLISTESLRGKYLLIDFWASWCKPCLDEIPNMKNAYQEYHGKGFEIYGISLDQQKEAWEKCIAKNELNWIHVSDLLAFNSPVTKKIAVNYVPHTFLLDPKGVILAVDLRGEEISKMLAELLN